jgi:hypothetical protein
MFTNVLSHKGNANQNYIEILIYPNRMAINKKTNIISAWKQGVGGEREGWGEREGMGERGV